MGMSVGGGEGGPRAEINVTPLVDVVLVLLIIFMVVTPMLQKGKEVDLPTAQNIDEEVKEEEPLIISVTKDHKIWMGQTELTEVGIEKVVKDTLARTPGRTVLVKGDRALPVKDIRLVMHRVQQAGAKRVGLGVDQPGDK
ncbi:MAG: biopolymer transporter ExbD [Myxococcales bacterium]|nr:biopolymer transporter ExbD [Myxococcales bacterium]MCB9736233.1 biopolymer transporter ExbD [Deltaproteobacteria bacterium]